MPHQEHKSKTPSIHTLLDIMKSLRDPLDGCPWDRKQNFKSIAPYTIEEAYEVHDAIMREDMDDLKDELGDLLLQVVFHTQMAKEQNAFNFTDVVSAICDKMTRRHPHVFGDVKIQSLDDIRQNWEKIKHSEKEEKKHKSKKNSEEKFDTGKASLPPHLRALTIQKEAAHYNFDWNNPADICDKIHEECREVEAELKKPNLNKEALENEIGDLFFSVLNLARQCEVAPDQAIAKANAKFIKRFTYVLSELDEKQLTPDHRQNLDKDLLEKFWKKAKENE